MNQKTVPILQAKELRKNGYEKVGIRTFAEWTASPSFKKNPVGAKNEISDFAGRIARLLPGGIKLHSLKLYETTTSYAEWYAEDNQESA